eukprot:7836652-Pyramimonas_sp.AAC.1
MAPPGGNQFMVDSWWELAKEGEKAIEDILDQIKILGEAVGGCVENSPPMGGTVSGAMTAAVATDHYAAAPGQKGPPQRRVRYFVGLKKLT